MDANINYSECVKAMGNIGNTVYQNICSGEVETVVWGIADWVDTILVWLLILLPVVFVVFLMVLVIKELSY